MVGANFPETTLWSEQASFVTYGISATENKHVTDVSVYPNPSAGIVNIDFSVTLPSNVSITIVNVTGTSIYHEDLGIVQGNKTVHWRAVDENNAEIADGVFIALIKTSTYSVPVRIILRH
jgi:hypothetical protein